MATTRGNHPWVTPSVCSKMAASPLDARSALWFNTSKTCPSDPFDPRAKRATSEGEAVNNNQ